MGYHTDRGAAREEAHTHPRKTEVVAQLKEELRVGRVDRCPAEDEVEAPRLVDRAFDDVAVVVRHSVA